MRALLVMAGLAATALGADLSGIWIGQVPTRNGDMLDVEFKLVQTGTTLEGKLYGDYRSSPIREGKVTGDQVSFLVISQEQAGNQINDTRLRFTGVVKGEEIEITRERESATNAGNGGGVQFRGNAKTSFKLKRLFQTP